jgi:hypothetical protein
MIKNPIKNLTKNLNVWSAVEYIGLLQVLYFVWVMP